MAPARADPLESGFADPPVSARPLGWWHWINGNVTKEGISADLEAAKRAGMGGVQLFDVEIYLPPGPVRYGTDNWYDHVRFAMQKASDLGLEFHVMNTPGWSASGGPWVTPERSMKRLVWTETRATGGNELDAVLPLPDLKPIYSGRGVPKESFYRDVAVLAVPATTERIDDLERKIAWASKPVTRPAGEDRPGITPAQVLNLSSQMDRDGRLRVVLPPGEWILLRFGYTTTGKTNHPAVPEGHGLEIDKLDATEVAFQFEQSLGRMLKDAGPLAGKSFKDVLIDSYEVLQQNWTPLLAEKFRKLRRYDLLTYLPCITGRVVGDLDRSERFLWDFRRTLADLYLSEYVATFQEFCHQNGLLDRKSVV